MSVFDNLNFKRGMGWLGVVTGVLLFLYYIYVYSLSMSFPKFKIILKEGFLSAAGGIYFLGFVSLLAAIFLFFQGLLNLLENKPIKNPDFTF